MEKDPRQVSLALLPGEAAGAGERLHALRFEAPSDGGPRPTVDYHSGVSCLPWPIQLRIFQGWKEGFKRERKSLINKGAFSK